jgi:YaiO family outer membrane protein
MLAAFITLVLCAAPALADQQAQFTYTAIGFSSPGNGYGPWDIDDFRYIDSDTAQALVLDLSHRNDNDPAFPTSGNYGNLSYSRDLSSRWYLNGSAGFGSGNPFPLSVFHLEANYKVSSDYRFVVGAAGDEISYQQSLHTSDVGLSVAYYWPHVVAQLREYSVSNTNSPTRDSTFASLELRPSNMTDIVATTIVGPQYYEVIIPGLPPAFANTNGWVATLSYQQWVTKHFGLIVGGYLSDYTQYGTGAPLFAGRGFTFGASVR